MNRYLKNCLFCAACLPVVMVMAMAIGAVTGAPPRDEKSIGLLSRVARLEDYRHYHGIVDVNPDMPLSVDLHGSPRPFERVRIALRGGRFSTAHYTEMPQHSHKAITTQPEFTLRMAYAVLAGVKDNEDRGISRLLVSQDYHKDDGSRFRPQNGVLFNETRVIDLKTNVGVVIEDCGNTGVASRSGPQFSYAVDLQVFLVPGVGARVNITPEVMRTLGPKWESLGDGKDESTFTTIGTGLIDITHILEKHDGLNGARLEFALEKTGCKLHYDIICF